MIFYFIFFFYWNSKRVLKYLTVHAKKKIDDENTKKKLSVIGNTEKLLKIC